MKLLTLLSLALIAHINANEIKNIEIPDYIAAKKDGINIRRFVTTKTINVFVFPNPVRCQRSLELLDSDMKTISVFDMHKANALMKIIKPGEYYIKVDPQQDCKIAINGLNETDREPYWSKSYKTRGF